MESLNIFEKNEGIFKLLLIVNMKLIYRLGLATAPVLFACEQFEELDDLIKRRFRYGSCAYLVDQQGFSTGFHYRISNQGF